MTRRQNPYSASAGHDSARKAIAADEIPEARSRRATHLQEGVNGSPLDGTARLFIRKIYDYRRESVLDALRDNNATRAEVKTDGNYFHLTAKFPTVNDANLAANAIRAIISGADTTSKLF